MPDEALPGDVVPPAAEEPLVPEEPFVPDVPDEPFAPLEAVSVFVDESPEVVDEPSDACDPPLSAWEWPRVLDFEPRLSVL